MSTAPPVRLMIEPDLPAYKQLRDLMLAQHPEAFTSDALTEMRREAPSYRSRLPGGSNGNCLFTPNNDCVDFDSAASLGPLRGSISRFA